MRRRFPLVAIFYIVLATSMFFLIRGHIRFVNVETWPSVEALDVTESGQVTYHRTESRTGSGATTIDARQARFRYFVDGVEYNGTKSTPDGGPLPVFDPGPWRAYYNPKNPEIAVLSPQPYRGTGWIIAVAISGFVVAVHAIFHFREP